MKMSLKSFFILTAATFGLSTLTACNTIEGMGEDIEAGGDAIEESAEGAKNY